MYILILTNIVLGYFLGKYVTNYSSGQHLHIICRSLTQIEQKIRLPAIVWYLRTLKYNKILRSIYVQKNEFQNMRASHNTIVKVNLNWVSCCRTTPHNTTGLQPTRFRGIYIHQGCQMVSFQTQNSNLGTILRALHWKMLIYFRAIWNILQIFGIFYDQLVHFVFIWYIGYLSCN
jgi:hypothetical protein